MHTLVAEFDNDLVTTIGPVQADARPRPTSPRLRPGEVAEGELTSPGDRVSDEVAPLRGEVSERDSGKVAKRSTSPGHLDPITGLFIDPRTGEVMDR